MDNSELVNVLDTGENLGVHLAGFFFLEPSVLDDMLEKLAARAVLHDKVEIVVVLDHL